MSTRVEWLLPWTRRGHSGPFDDNFLCRVDERLYVMDNHRLALWCWWQHLNESERWSYLHIDRHYDALWQIFDPWPEHHQPEHRKDLNCFRQATVPLDDGFGDTALYRWDTITSALWSLHSNQMGNVSLTDAEDDFPAIPRATTISPWKLPAHLAFLAKPASQELADGCIVDVDVDYFTRRELDGAFGPVFSPSYVREVGRSLKAGLDSGRFGIVTIALSPETTGSWSLAEEQLAYLLEPFSVYEEMMQAGPPREP